jgi:hypothetical protein
VVRLTIANSALAKALAVFLAVVLSALGAGACGSSKVSTDTTGAGLPAESRSSRADASVKDTDGDNDSPGSRVDPDNDIAMTFGHAADAQDMAVVSALLRNYYRVAAAGDGGKACALLYGLFVESTVEEHNSVRRGGDRQTCAQIAANTFRRHHAELVEDTKAIDLTVLRVKRKRGLARVLYGATRERLVPLELDRGVWRMDTLIDNGAP